MAGRYPYYLLADSPKAEERSGIQPVSAFDGEASAAEYRVVILRKGFVYERVPHVTLKSIANNEEIDEIHAK